MTSHAKQPTLLGHPTGLYALFFAEMWERFSYYGMRALLIFYMTKGFLGYGDNEAYRVYGAYIALVYMTPFIGGMLADRLLGERRAVVLGGLLMATGHLLMTLEVGAVFYTALAFIIVGNGFFKPNISTMVGTLYTPGSPARDGGFTIFYMGINLGAAAAPLLCGYVGEVYGWHYGFGLATFGMLVGLAVFIVPTLMARVLILLGAVLTSGAMMLLQDNWLLIAVNGFVALMLVAAGVAAFTALGRAGLPPEAGGPPDPELMQRPVVAGLTLEWAIYLGSLVVIPLVATLVWSNRMVTLIPETVIAGFADSDSGLVRLVGTLAAEISTPTGLMLAVTGMFALVFIVHQATKAPVVERDRLLVAVTLMFFSMLFWAFFEQASSSINHFTDRNVDRVFEERVLTEADIGTRLDLTLGQEQLGYPDGDHLFTMDRLTQAEEAAKKAKDPTMLDVTWTVTPDHVGMGVGGSNIPASTFQSANPIFILLFALPFSFGWMMLSRLKLEPNTPVKFALGLAQLSLGFVVLWYAAKNHDARGMVTIPYLLAAYLLHTTGELCLSPVGLSMVTRLSPKRLVSTMMGAWFLATAFSSYASAIIATFTGVAHGGGGEENVIPPPIDTVMVYGSVFGQIAIASAIAAFALLLLSPLLKRGMHGEN